MSTLKYQAPIKITNSAAQMPIDARRRTAGQPYLPTMIAGVPPASHQIAVVYSNKGAYLGWLEVPDAKAWYYSLFYATGNKYKVRTQKYTSHPEINRGVVIEEKNSGQTALYIGFRGFRVIDTIDSEDRKNQATTTLGALKDTYMSADNRHFSVSDPFNLLKGVQEPALEKLNKSMERVRSDLMATQIAYQKEMQDIKDKALKGPIETYRKELEDYLNSIVSGEDATTKGSEEAGVNLDI